MRGTFQGSPLLCGNASLRSGDAIGGVSKTGQQLHPAPLSLGSARIFTNKSAPSRYGDVRWPP